MRRLPDFVVLAVIALVFAGTALGSGSEQPESKLEGLVRGWNDAVNASDNRRAGAFFAPDAVVVNGPNSNRFTRPTDAIVFNATLPCTASIESMDQDGPVVAATFVIQDPRTAGVPCYGNGARVGALFTFRGEQIAVFELAGSPEAVVSDWGESMRTGDLVRAAEYFARDAVVVAGATTTTLATPERARALLARDGCAVTVIESKQLWNRVTAELAFADGATGSCARAGETDVGLFTVTKGRIVEWIQGVELTFRF